MKRYYAVAVLLFFLTALLLSYNLGKPFYGEHDWNGVRYGNIARNYLRYGWRETRLGQVENSGLVGKEGFEYFTHYPPLLPLLISASFQLFGVGEWQARLVTLLVSCGTVTLIFLIGRKAGNFATGLCSALLVLATPQLLYFGKTAVHEPVVVFFALLSFLGFLHKRKALFYFGLVMAELTTWAGYFLAPALTVALLVKRDFGGLKGLLPVWVISVLVFTLHITHTYILTGEILGGGFGAVFLQRAALSSAGQIDNLTPLAYLNQIRLWMMSLYSLPLLVLGGIGVIGVIREKSFADMGQAVLTLGVFGSAYLVLFPNSSFIHNYITFYLLPFVGLSAGAALARVGKIREIWVIRGMGEIRGVRYLLLIAIISLVFIERFDYLKALDRSDADRLGWAAGLALKKQTEPDERIFVTPKIFYYREEKFLRFYSDRRLVLETGREADATLLVDQDNGRFDILKK